MPNAINSIAMDKKNTNHGQMDTRAGKKYGYNDVYHLATGTFDEENVMVAIARACAIANMTALLLSVNKHSSCHYFFCAMLVVRRAAILRQERKWEYLDLA